MPPSKSVSSGTTLAVPAAQPVRLEFPILSLNLELEQGVCRVCREDEARRSSQDYLTVWRKYKMWRP
jgi:hypothetical protein